MKEEVENTQGNLDLENQNTEAPTDEMTNKDRKEDKSDGNNVSQEAEKLSHELAEMKDKHLRLYSEFENFRRRMMKEKADLTQQANRDLLLAILPVYDDFERALDAMARSNDKEALTEGVKLIFNKFGNILQQSGLKAIGSKGEVFDPELHEAVTKIPAPDPSLKGKVVDEIQKGYQLNDKIIRYAKVVVGE